MAADAGFLSALFNLVTGRIDNASGLARFIHRIGRLKSVTRVGWLDRGVPAPDAESVADHSYRVAMIVWLASAEAAGLDRDRMIKLALLHDLAESLTGDTTPYDPAMLEDLDADSRRAALNQRQKISVDRKEAKRQAEKEAIAGLIADLAPILHDEIASLWQELEQHETPESRFVKEIDILETYLQSREYLAGDRSLPMDSFAAEVAEAITSVDVGSLRDAIDSLCLDPLEESL